MSRALAVFGALATLFGGLLLYARAELFDPDALAERAGSALSDEDVRLAISPTVAEAIAQVSPADEPSTKEVADALKDPRVVAAFGVASGRAADQLFGEGRDALALDLSDVTAETIRVTESASLDELGVDGSDIEAARLKLIEGKAVLDALDAIERVGNLGLILAPLGVIALMLSIGLAPDRLRGLTFASLSVAVVAVLGLAALYVGREVATAQFHDELTRDAVASAWGSVLGGLQRWAIAIAAVAAVIALLSGLAAARARPVYR